jgi:hypothetical protein
MIAGGAEELHVNRSGGHSAVAAEEEKSMRCPQCGAENAEDAWNCVSCRINLYWAHQHYNELAQIREQQGLASGAASPSFLVASHSREMGERASRGLQVMNKVRTIAWRVMRGEAVEGP